MYVSTKFDAYYNKLSEEDQIEAAKAVIVLCDDHERYMARKEEEMKNLLQQVIEAAAALNLERLASLKEEVEKKKESIIPIERFIEINFGL